MKYCVLQVFILVIAVNFCYDLAQGCPLCEPVVEVQGACHLLKRLKHCIPKPSIRVNTGSSDCACQWKTFINSIEIEQLNTVPSGRQCYMWARDACKGTRSVKQRPRSVPSFPNDETEISDEEKTLDDAILAAQKLRSHIDYVQDPAEKHDVSDKLVKLMRKISVLEKNIGQKTGSSLPGYIFERQKDNNFVGHVPFPAQVLVDTEETKEEKEERERLESIEDVKFKLTIFVAILLFNIGVFIVAILMRCDKKRKRLANQTVGDLDLKRNIKWSPDDHMHKTNLDNFMDKLRGHMREKAAENERKGSHASTKTKGDFTKGNYNRVHQPVTVHRYSSTQFDDSSGDDDVFTQESVPGFYKSNDSYEVAEIDIPNGTRTRPKSVSWLEGHEFLTPVGSASSMPPIPSGSSIPSRLRRENRQSQTSQTDSQIDTALLTMLN